MKVVCFGDSITYGFPYGPEYSWVNFVEKKTGIEMINAGENGNTAVDLLGRMSWDVLPHRPEYTFIMIGTNDASIGIKENTFMKNLSEIVYVLQSENIKSLIGLPIPSSDDSLELLLVSYRQQLSAFSIKSSIPYLDFSAAMMDTNNEIAREYYMDEVHPSPKGYSVMGIHAIPFFTGLKYGQISL